MASEPWFTVAYQWTKMCSTCAAFACNKQNTIHKKFLQMLLKNPGIPFVISHNDVVHLVPPFPVAWRELPHWGNPSLAGLFVTQKKKDGSLSAFKTFTWKNLTMQIVVQEIPWTMLVQQYHSSFGFMWPLGCFTKAHNEVTELAWSFDHTTMLDKK